MRDEQLKEARFGDIDLTIKFILGSSGRRRINIAVLLPMTQWNAHAFLPGVQMYEMVRYSMVKIEQYLLENSDIEMEVVVYDSGTTPMYSIRQAFKAYFEKPAAIIGPCVNEQVEVVAAFFGMRNYPLVLPAYNGNRLLEWNYNSFLMRMSHYQEAFSILQVFKTLNTSDISILFSNDNLGIGGSQMLSDACVRAGIQVHCMSSYDGTEAFHNFASCLMGASKVEAVVLWMPDLVARKVLRAISFREWPFAFRIFLCDDATYLYGSEYTPTLFSAFGIRQHTLNSLGSRSFLKEIIFANQSSQSTKASNSVRLRGLAYELRLDQLFRDVYCCIRPGGYLAQGRLLQKCPAVEDRTSVMECLCTGDEPIDRYYRTQYPIPQSMHMDYLHDSLWFVAQGLVHLTKGNDRMEFSSKEIFDAFRNTVVEGDRALTGRVEYTTKSSPFRVKPQFDVYQFVGDGVRTVGYVDNYKPALDKTLLESMTESQFEEWKRYHVPMRSSDVNSMLSQVSILETSWGLLLFAIVLGLLVAVFMSLVTVHKRLRHTLYCQDKFRRRWALCMLWSMSFILIGSLMWFITPISWFWCRLKAWFCFAGLIMFASCLIWQGMGYMVALLEAVLPDSILAVPKRIESTIGVRVTWELIVVCVSMLPSCAAFLMHQFRCGGFYGSWLLEDRNLDYRFYHGCSSLNHDMSRRVIRYWLIYMLCLLNATMISSFLAYYRGIGLAFGQSRMTLVLSLDAVFLGVQFSPLYYLMRGNNAESVGRFRLRTMITIYGIGVSLAMLMWTILSSKDVKLRAVEAMCAEHHSESDFEDNDDGWQDSDDESGFENGSNSIKESVPSVQSKDVNSARRDQVDDGMMKRSLISVRSDMSVCSNGSTLVNQSRDDIY